MPPGTYQRRQASGGAHRLSATRVTFDCNADANNTRLGSRVLACQCSDVLRWNAGNLCHHFGWIGFNSIPEFIEAERVVCDIVAVDKVLLDDHVHHPECKSPVGTGTNRNMPVGFLGGTCFERINHYQLCTVLFCLGDKWPVMQVGADCVASPKNDILGIFETLRVHSRRGPYGHEVGRARTRVTESPFADRRAELVEERIPHIETIEGALRAQIAVR